MKMYYIIGIIICLMLLIGACNSTNKNLENSEAPNITNESQDQNKLVESTEKEEVTKKYSKKEYKKMCTEIVYNDIDKKIIGQYVTKELIIGNSNILEDGTILYTCGATEDFLEEYDFYQHTYRVYEIKDCRKKKDFPIESNDVMRVYGVVENINKNNRNGFYTPTIKVYYADYIRRYGENKDNAKSAKEVKKEREKITKENEYRDSLNTDYTGVTKNKRNMNTLTLNKYIKYCDSMNYQNIVNTSEDLTGRYVKLHIQVTDHKIFTSDDSKNNRLGEWTKPKKVQDDVWYCKLLYERTGEYVYPKSNIDTVYFLKTENIDASSLSEGDNLVVYGQIVNYDVEDGEFELLVRYYEKE